MQDLSRKRPRLRLVNREEFFQHPAKTCVNRSVSSNLLAFLLVFGLGHPAREPLDPAKSVPLHSRIPCDGNGAPEDLLRVQATFSPGAWAREFVVSHYANGRCEVDVHVKCLHKEKPGWHDVWSTTNAEPTSRALVPVTSCYEWGSNVAAQYVLSGRYQEGAADPKLAWHQAAVKLVSGEQEVYEFTDPKGGTARLQITH
jgi:hypothetical protein